MRKRIVIDTDPGIDDAIAIMTALECEDLDVLGISVVFGNVSLDKTLRNALRILNYMKKTDIPVYSGAHKPMYGEWMEATDIHGDDGLGNINLRASDMMPQMKSSVQFLLDISREYPKDLTLVTLGPLTNIATAIIMDNEFVDRIDSMVSMAGAYGLTEHGVGNITPKAEFNIYCDPIAAKIVFSSSIDKYLIGLDVTCKPDTMLDGDDMNRLSMAAGRGRLIYIMLKDLFQSSGGHIPIHDPHTIMYLIRPEIYRFESFFVDVEAYGEETFGETVVDNRRGVPDWLRRGYPANICVDVDGKKFKEELFRILI